MHWLVQKSIPNLLAVTFLTVSGWLQCQPLHIPALELDWNRATHTSWSVIAVATCRPSTVHLPAGLSHGPYSAEVHSSSDLFQDF